MRDRAAPKVWIARHNDSASAASGVRVSLGRSPSDPDSWLVWSNDAVAFSASGTAVSSVPQTPPPVGLWYLDALVRSSAGTRITLYRAVESGAALSGKAATALPGSISANDLTVGVDPRGLSNYLTGRVAVLLIYSRALSMAQVAQLAGAYSRQFGFPAAPG
ncbi:hypothetical protein HYH03_016325 [Edaphochlamys debaryana]|uniref:Uncharacterized protein n=1 Tax=Edaphochlamys debaryana TaxID=47281 RepID=A0A835XRY1_9CHLO|nr:hypothetical protein HYH03_016325 [Edaphochlamys debaryana]|eukprot:KAG2484939.1 hypothetical protein HYH03_016325 [Edaphochlamys debaryana]